MSETPQTTPPPGDPAPTPAAVRRRCNWHRVRVYFWSILICAAMWFGVGLYIIRFYPKIFVDRMMAELPFASSTGEVNWLNRRTLQVSDIKVGGFFYADTVIITASPFGLIRQHVAKIQVLGGQLYTKPLYAALEKVGPGSGKGIDWVIGRLEIGRGTVLLNNFIAGTSIPVRLGVRHPIVLTGLRLGAPDSSKSMDNEQMVEIGQVNIVSPIDPVAPVFAFPLTRVSFTWRELWQHQVRSVEMIRPTMFLGEDLFWLVREFKEDNTPKDKGPEAPWHVNHFSVDYGRLAVNAFGQPVVQLPFFFETKVDNIRLDQLDKITAKSSIAIRRLDQDYPDYKVRLVNLRGNLYFSLPITDANANNVVNSIQIEELIWNHIPVKNVSTTVTFDPNGVYGRLNGACEGGQLTGNFEFYYSKGFTWNADLFADKINCQPIAEKLVGKYVNLTGELDGKIRVQGKVTEILQCKGELELPNPGNLEIKSMKDLLDRIPADMISIKRQAMEIAIKTFQEYPYDQGILTLDYTPDGGQAVLKLGGSRGARLFQVYLHPYNLTDAKK